MKEYVKNHKSPYDHVIYDSDIEFSFAQSFEKNDEIKVYAQLPKWFKIDTPLGSYTPDWAVLFEQDGQEKLYFVVESKGSIFEDMLRDLEKAKIHCGHEHFKALGENTQYIVSDNYETFIDQALQKDTITT
ncbi:hypothetical protein [Bartonella sp. CL100XZDX]|uniref:restriction endonuclease n=1 Tax=Bartonella sp. CL100XZDX TaxID=3243515 RepID=UPI0035D066E5